MPYKLCWRVGSLVGVTPALRQRFLEEVERPRRKVVELEERLEETQESWCKVPERPSFCWFLSRRRDILRRLEVGEEREELCNGEIGVRKAACV